VRFQLLGPLRVDVDGEPVGLGGTKQRMVLAHLLLNAGKTVRAAQLVDVLWGAEPPTSAAANLQTYVWRLRRTLPFDGLVTSGTGYELRTPPETVDAWLFRDACARARAERDPVVALAALREAEGLWQGDPLADLPAVPAWEAELSGLSEARLAATEDRLALQVRLGDHGPVIEELAGLLAEHPYRERLWQQYLLALAGAGRRADALAAYADVRARFVANLGVEPGPALRDAHAAVLRDETPAETPAETPVTAVHQLPADLPDFVGRAVAVVGLVSALAPRPGTFAAPVAVVSGPPGTGKSVLALHVAHRLRADYPDGQFYADLDATGDRPRGPADVLADFLHALGVFGAGLPDGATARAALFRSRLAGRRVLVVLDDAASAAQVRPLLPADGGCAVLITARSRLPGLTGVHDVELAVFGARESTRLLAAVAGAERVAAEAAHAADIVEFCGHLPLAIRIAGTRLAGRRAWSLRTLRDRLADESTRLRELRAGDLAVRQSFELSLRQLPDAGVRAFGRLALLGGREFPAWAVDALLGEPAHDVLDLLVDANLVALAGPDRGGHPQYALHSLLHIHAQDIVAAEPADERAAAFRRAMSALLSLVKRAAAGLPAAFGAVTGEPLGWTLGAEVERAVVAEPLAWFAAQRVTLARAVELTAAAGEAELAWQLAAAAVPFQDLRGHYDDWRAGHEHALAAVRRAGDVVGEAALLRGLGQVHLYRDEYGAARRAFTRSASLFAEMGDLRGEAFAVAGLGTLARVADRPEAALPHYLRALDRLRVVGDRSGEAQMLGSLGTVCHVLGRPAEAADRLSAALAVAVEIGDRHREAKVRTELGAVHRGTGDFVGAERELSAALGILEGLRDERCTAYALLGIGETLLATGAAERARGVGERALDVFRQTGNRRGETQALLLLAHCRRARWRVVP
jgi:DNA-binding SARP family transcriptional activator/tetratricopeptide (TPR) repeat protein